MAAKGLKVRACAQCGHGRGDHAATYPFACSGDCQCMCFAQQRQAYSPVEPTNPEARASLGVRVNGRKDDDAKPDFRAYLSPLLASAQLAPAIAAVVRVLAYGAKKYGAGNWAGVGAERYDKAALRHLQAHLADPASVDSDTGESHLAHLICCALFNLARLPKAGPPP